MLSVRVLVSLVLVLLALPSGSRAQDRGVMLGLRYEEPIPRPLPYYAGSADSLSRDAYQTLIIWKAGDTFGIRGAVDELVIPQTGRFWRVDTKRSIYNNWVEDFVWSTPASQAPDYAGIQSFNGEYCEGHRRQTIHYAGPRYLSLQQQSAGYCEGAAHPWFFNTFAVVPLDSTTHTGLSIDDVLGEDAYTVFEEHADAYLNRLRDDARRSLYSDVPDPANWAIVHQDGRWTVLGRLESAEAIAPGHIIDLPLPVALPQQIAGPQPAAPTWAQIRTAVPNAVDALLAPEGDWLIVVRPSRLTLHAFANGRVGPAQLSQPLPPGSRIVMARWASANQLRPWRQHIERLTATAPPP